MVVYAFGGACIYACVVDVWVVLDFIGGSVCILTDVFGISSFEVRNSLRFVSGISW